jgi:hypothetical protein
MPTDRALELRNFHIAGMVRIVGKFDRIGALEKVVSAGAVFPRLAGAKRLVLRSLGIIIE